MRSLLQFGHDLAESIRIFWANPRCRHCGERTTDLAFHYEWEHSGDNFGPAR